MIVDGDVNLSWHRGPPPLRPRPTAEQLAEFEARQQPNQQPNRKRTASGPPEVTPENPRKNRLPPSANLSSRAEDSAQTQDQPPILSSLAIEEESRARHRREIIAEMEPIWDARLKAELKKSQAKAKKQRAEQIEAVVEQVGSLQGQVDTLTKASEKHKANIRPQYQRGYDEGYRVARDELQTQADTLLTAKQSEIEALNQKISDWRTEAAAYQAITIAELKGKDRELSELQREALSVAGTYHRQMAAKDKVIADLRPNVSPDIDQAKEICHLKIQRADQAKEIEGLKLKCAQKMALLEKQNGGRNQTLAEDLPSKSKELEITEKEIKKKELEWRKEVQKEVQKQRERDGWGKLNRLESELRHSKADTQFLLQTTDELHARELLNLEKRSNAALLDLKRLCDAALLDAQKQAEADLKNLRNQNRTALDALSSDKLKLENDLHRTNSQLEKANASRDAGSEENSKLRTEVKLLESRLGEAISDLRNANAFNDAESEENSELRKRVEDAESRSRRAWLVLKKTRSDLEVAKAKLENRAVKKPKQYRPAGARRTGPSEEQLYFFTDSLDEDSDSEEATPYRKQLAHSRRRASTVQITPDSRSTPAVPSVVSTLPTLPTASNVVTMPIASITQTMTTVPTATATPIVPTAPTIPSVPVPTVPAPTVLVPTAPAVPTTAIVPAVATVAIELKVKKTKPKDFLDSACFLFCLLFLNVAVTNFTGILLLSAFRHRFGANPAYHPRQGE